MHIDTNTHTHACACLMVMGLKKRFSGSSDRTDRGSMADRNRKTVAGS